MSFFHHIETVTEEHTSKNTVEVELKTVKIETKSSLIQADVYVMKLGKKYLLDNPTMGRGLSIVDGIHLVKDVKDTWKFRDIDEAVEVQNEFGGDIFKIHIERVYN